MTPGTGVATPHPYCRQPSRIRRPQHASRLPVHAPSRAGRCQPIAPAPQGWFFATRTGGAGTVASISGREKRKAIPTIATGAAHSDRVGDAHDAPPSRSLSSTTPTSSRRRSRPSVLRDALRCQRACIPVRGMTRLRVTARAASPRRVDDQAAFYDARNGRRPSPSSMSPTVADPPPPARIASTRPRPLQGRALSANERPPHRAGSSPRVPAGPGLSARSQDGGTGRRRRCRPVALPTPIASTTRLIGRRQRLSRRRRRRVAGFVEYQSSSGMPCVSNERQSLSGTSPPAGRLPAWSSP